MSVHTKLNLTAENRHNPLYPRKSRQTVSDHELFLIHQTWATVPSQSSSEGKNMERTTHMDEPFFFGCSFTADWLLIDWLIDWLANWSTSSTYYQVISRFSFTVPRSLMSTATTWGRAANRSFVSQVTLPTRIWVASPLTSVTCKRQEQDT